MSLFPAYAQDLGENNVDYKVACVQESSNVSPALEAQLLESESEDERENGVTASATVSTRRSSALESSDYYLDRKFDCGNLRVSTLYYPGRPQYEAQKRTAVGGGASLGAAKRGRQRYFETPLDNRDASIHEELAERTRAFRQMLTDQPTDEALWLRFIDFQERYRDAEAALAVAGEAAARLLNVSARVRSELHRLRARVLQPHQCLDLLRAELAEAQNGAALSTELWLRLLDAVASRGDGGELDAAAAAALGATRAVPTAYPHILYVYGSYLRSAGLWERLVLLLELVTSMNFGPDVFPPPPDHARMERVERDLQDTEDKVIGSGLPLSTVWVRVERARAAAHWRAGEAGVVDVDPQRVPLAADVAELLLPAQAPVAQHLLLVNALRLAKVPLLPCSGYALRAADASNNAAGDCWWASCGEALMALVRAARRLPAAHPARARPAAAARLLAHFVDPPHYFSDDTGYLSWVRSLWEACCGWTSGAVRVALVCWRLRWLHALLLLVATGEGGDSADETRRVRTEARAVLKRWAGDSPLPYAQFARLERAAAGTAPARRAALKALRAALQDSAAPPCQRLYVARVATEICDETDSCAGTWAAVCAVLATPLPSDERLGSAPPRDMINEAQRRCEEECAELEAALSVRDDDDGGDVAGPLAAMLPSEAEWAAARARLSAAPRRAELLRHARRAATLRLGPAALRYWEHSACALVLAAAREHRMVVTARAFALLFPHNALLALACSGGPLWLWEAGAEREQQVRAAHTHARTHVGALAHVLPPLLRACASDWQPNDAAQVVSACARAGRAGAGGALLGAARLEAEARAPRPRPAPALLAALADHPHHKWLYVRGAAWCSAEAAALADVLLERALRTHALRDELASAPLPQ